MKTWKMLTLATAWLALAIAGTGMAAPPVSGSTVVTFSANPATLSGDATVDVTITATTTSSAGQPYIDDGKVTILVATDGSGNPVSSGDVVEWVPLNVSGTHPVNGVLELGVDLDALGCVPGSFVGFCAHYVTGGGSTKVAEHWSDPVDLEIEEEGTWVPETAWADGLPYNGTGGGNWATYTPYYGEPKTVALYAGQTMPAGTVQFSAPAGGLVTITITLDAGWRFYDDAENVKIQGYAEAPSGNPNPGSFAIKGEGTGSSFSIDVLSSNYYGVHVDVEWLDTSN